MSNEQERAQRYRTRAVEFRAIADLDRDTQNHNALMEIAERYDQMAQRLETIDRAYKSWQEASARV